MKVKREIDIDHEIDEAIAMLSATSGNSYSVCLEKYLLTNKRIKGLVKRLHNLPEMPDGIQYD